MTTFLHRRAPGASLALLASLLITPAARAQTDSNAPLALPTATVVVLPVALYNAQANVQEASDPSQAILSTQVLTGRLRELLGPQLLAGPEIALVAASPRARATTGNQPCNVIVACARSVADSLNAPWVVIAKVSKTSNLIWLFTGQLIHAPTGKIVLDDSTELKGPPEGMVRAGSRIFAERVARTVHAGGMTTNFPNTP
ncbi:MAG: DUF2380 domain-containing protein [Gemmatimonadales bacterium]